MTRSRIFYFFCAVILSLQLLLDVVFVVYWSDLSSRLGPLLGLELGLAIFLNFLGVLLLFELLGDRARPPRWLGAYHRLRASRQLRRRAGSGWSVLTARVAALTFFFYGMQTFLLPFVPSLWRSQLEVAAVVGAVLWRFTSLGGVE